MAGHVHAFIIGGQQDNRPPEVAGLSNGMRDLTAQGIHFHAGQQPGGDAGELLELFVQFMFTQAGALQHRGLIFQKGQDHAERHKHLGRVPQFAVDMLQAPGQQRGDGKHRAP